jgi:hypothetical protein
VIPSKIDYDTYIMIETKQDAIDLFGTITQLADGLQISRQTIYNWPELLEIRHVDQVMGAAFRHRLLSWDDVLLPRAVPVKSAKM